MRNHRLIRRAVGVAAIVAVAAGTMLATSAPVQATAPTYFRINAGLTPQVNLAIHITTTANYAQPVLQPFTGTTHGQWELVPRGGIGFFQLKNRYSHQCLSGRFVGPPPPETIVPGPVFQHVCDATDIRQYWLRNQDPVLPVWRVVNFGNLLALSAPAAGTGVVEAIPSTTDTKQMWQMW
jgi:hypothetical protein